MLPTCGRCGVLDRGDLDRGLPSSHLGLLRWRRLGPGTGHELAQPLRREGQRGDSVPGQPGRGLTAGAVGAALTALPEPGLVGVLHHPPAQTVLQRVLVAFGKRLPLGVSELLHVLRPDFLGHHGCGCDH